METTVKQTQERFVAKVMGREIALKIQRRKHCGAAQEEVYVYDVLRSEGIHDAGIIELFEVFAHDGHICMAFELHGRELEELVPKSGMPSGEVKHIARQLLGALQTMHAVGFAHSDIKPENVLYDPQTGIAKLIDMSTADTSFGRGSRIATREFTPPEVVLGTDLGTPMDIWSLGCSLFYLLSGTVAFHPHKVAREKYVEFQPGWTDENNDFELEARDDSDVFPDAALAPGDVLAGKYRLVSILGKGSFGTVWRALPQHDDPLMDQAWKTLEDAEKIDPERADGAAGEVVAWEESVDEDDGDAIDMYDLVLNFEMLVEMERRLGPFGGFGAGGVYYDRYFNVDGSYKFPAEPSPVPIESTLIERAGMEPAEARDWQDFLLRMLRYEPEARPTAAQCLADPWLAS